VLGRFIDLREEIKQFMKKGQASVKISVHKMDARPCIYGEYY